MNLKELLVKIGFDIEGKEKLHHLEEQLEGIKRRLEFLAAMEVAKGIYELVEKFAHFAEEIHVAAQSIGVTAEEFQKLAFSAKQSAVSQEEMSAAMFKLSRNLYMAKQGSAEAQKAFQEAGFNALQIQNFKTADQVLLALSQKFQNIDDFSKKAAISTQLMGRGSRTMVGWISQGPDAIKRTGEEAEKLGAILSEEQLEALVEVEHAFQKLWAAMKGISAWMASIFAPELTYIVNRILDFWKANLELVKVDIEEWIKKFIYGLGFLFGVIEGMIKVIQRFAEEHKTLFRFVETIGAIAGAIIAATLAFDKLKGSVGLLAEGFKFFNGLLLANPLTPWILGIGAVVLAVQELWAALHGEKGWLSQWLDWLGVLKPIESFLNSIGDAIVKVMNFLSTGEGFGKLFDSASEKFKAIAGSIGSLFGLNTPEESPVAKVAGGFQNLPASAPTDKSYFGTTESSDNSVVQTNQINAPVTINVPAGVDHKEVHQSVKDGIREHLDRVSREVNRSLKPTVAY
jgi:hypothetical protein